LGCIEAAPSAVDNTCAKDTLDNGNGIVGARALATWGGYVFVAGGGDGDVIVVLKAETSGLTPVSCINPAGTGGCAKATPLGQGNASDIPSIVVSPNGEHVYLSTSDLILMFSFNPATHAITWANNSASCVSQDGTDGGSGRCTKTPSGVPAYYNVVMGPGGNYLYNFGNGGNSSLVTYKVGSDGSLTPVGCIDSGACGGTSGKTDARGILDVEAPNFGGANGLAISTAGQRAYAADASSDALWMFDIVPAGQPGAGSLALPDGTGTSGPADYCVEDGTSASTCTHHGWGLAQLSGGITLGGTGSSQYIYMVSGGEGNPGSVLELEGATPAALAETGCVSSTGTDDDTPSKACTKQAGLADAGDVVESPDGKDLYIAAGDQTSGQVVELAVDPSTGALSPGACYSDDGAGGNGTAYPGCTHFQGLWGVDAESDPNSAIAVSPAGAPTVSPSGSEVYVAAGQDGSVADLARGKVPTGTVRALIGAPTKFAAAASDGEVELSWSPPATGAASSYTLQWRAGASGSITTTTVNVGHTEVIGHTVVKGLDNRTKYEFALSAVVAGQTGLATPWLSATPSSGLPPLPPTALTAKVSADTVINGKLAATTGFVDLRWIAPPAGSCSSGGCKLSGYHLNVLGPPSGVHGTQPVLLIKSLAATSVSAQVQLGLSLQTDTFSLESLNLYGKSTSAQLLVPMETPPVRPNVTAAAANTGVDLSWDDDPSRDALLGIGPVTTIDVFDGTAEGQVTTPVPSGDMAVTSKGLGPSGRSTTVTVTGLPAGTTYYFEVAVSDAAGASPVSRSVSAIIPGPPQAPIDVVANRGNGLVVLTWQPPTEDGGAPITGYQVFMGTKAGGEGQVPIASPGANSLLVHGEPVKVDNGTTYYFTVKAVNANGAGPASSEVSATPDPVLPGPQDLTAMATPAGGGVTLNWSAVHASGSNSLTGYDVFQSTAPVGPSTAPTAVAASATSYTVTGLTPGTMYYFEMTSVNNYGQGTLSNEATATPAPVVSEPGPPINLVAQRGNDLVVLTWQPPSSDGGAQVTGYHVYMGTSPRGESSTPISSGNATGLLIRSPDPVKITNGTKYYFTVKAVNISGPGPASDEASATPAPVPGAPQDLAATSTGGSVTLTWSAEQGVSGYDLYQGTAPGPASAAPTTLAASATSDTLTGLKVGVTHYFYLTAVNSAGQSLPSAEASAEPVGAPSAPAVTVDPGIGSVKVSWQKPQDQGSPVTGYTLLWRDITTGVITPVTLGAGSITHTVDGLNNGSSYEFAVEATNAVGTGPASPWAFAQPSSDGTPPPPTFMGYSTQAVRGGSGEVTVTWSEEPAHLSGYVMTFDETVTKPNPDGVGTEIKLLPKTLTLRPTTTSYTTELTLDLAKDPFILKAEISGEGRSTSCPICTGAPLESVPAEIDVPLEVRPDAPAPIAVPGSKQVTLSWADDAALEASQGTGAVTDFEVFQGTSAGREATTPLVGSELSVHTTGSWSGAVRLNTEFSVTITVKGLDAGTTYYFEVAQGDAAGFSPNSQEVEATPTG
jgi:titin